jgi:hypothetical protein
MAAFEGKAEIRRGKTGCGQLRVRVLLYIHVICVPLRSQTSRMYSEEFSEGKGGIVSKRA